MKSTLYSPTPTTTLKAGGEVKAEASTQIRDYFTPHGNSPSVPGPVKFDAGVEGYVEAEQSVTVPLPNGAQVTTETSRRTNTEGETRETTSTSAGRRGTEVYIETTTDPNSGQSATRAGVKVESEKKVGPFYYEVGASASGGETEP